MGSQAGTVPTMVVAQSRSERWPDVYVAQSARLRGSVAKWIVRSALRDLPMRLRFPDGRIYGAGGPGAPTLAVHRPEAFYARIGARGLIGFGESYQAGEWGADDLAGVLTVLGARVDALVPSSLQRLRRLYVARRPHAERNSPTGARRNIARHYDLSDELFASFLDPTMSYSSALFAQDEAGSPVASTGLLTLAQQRKIDRLLDLTGVGPGTRVLEVGSGWGELAVRAAARGARVRTVTLSENQRAYTARRAAQAGLGGALAVELRDYRAIEGEYDVVLSVEMIEAVGREHWPQYFAMLARVLAPGGRIGLQSITMAHHRMTATADTQTWITKYIFPGGLIPSVTAIEENAARFGLRVADDLAFGAHYAQTLRLWRERFCQHADRLAALGFDETFRRTWDLYLSYCQAGFDCGYLDVHQFLITARG